MRGISRSIHRATTAVIHCHRLPVDESGDGVHQSGDRGYFEGGVAVNFDRFCAAPDGEGYVPYEVAMREEKNRFNMVSLSEDIVIGQGKIQVRF